MTELEKQYIWACYLYYWMIAESPWSDYYFDEVQADFQKNYSKCSAEFKKQVKKPLKSTAHTIQFTDQQKIDAEVWANNQ
jgi:hypothetical protein